MKHTDKTLRELDENIQRMKARRAADAAHTRRRNDLDARRGRTMENVNR